MEFAPMIVLLPIFVVLLGIQSEIRNFGMHRVTNEVFHDLVVSNPECYVLVKHASFFGKAQVYILLISGAKIYTRASAPLRFPSSTKLISTFVDHK